MRETLKATSRFIPAEAKWFAEEWLPAMHIHLGCKFCMKEEIAKNYGHCYYLCTKTTNKFPQLAFCVRDELHTMYPCDIPEDCPYVLELTMLKGEPC